LLYATLVFTFFANLLWTATLADGKNQLNWVAVNDGKERWIGHQQLTPILMDFEQTSTIRSVPVLQA